MKKRLKRNDIAVRTAITFCIHLFSFRLYLFSFVISYNKTQKSFNMKQFELKDDISINLLDALHMLRSV